MMDKPLVSICCITYNHASFIRKCIDGFLMQKAPSCVSADAKMSDWCEILIHDDCSTDGTTDIVKEYATKYPDLIFPLYEKENQYSKGKAGKIDLYNYERARGKYIAYCEGDDYWTEPLKLQIQIDFLETHPDYSVCFHRCKHVNVADYSEKEDGCGLLFQHDEVGVNIDVTLFFKHWINQPQNMVFRASMHDMSLAYRYKYYRDTHEIYHLLMSGNGYLFGFVGGVRIMHPDGIASLIGEEETAIKERDFAEELYGKNRSKHTYENFFNVSLWCYDVLLREKNWALLFIFFKMLVKFPSLTMKLQFVLFKRKILCAFRSDNVLVRCKRYCCNHIHPVIGEVWQLHRVRNELSNDEELRLYEITPHRLESLIISYLKDGFEFISMDKVCDYVSNKITCNKKFIAVTLDDGYEDNFSVAYPILKKYNIPFCVYISQSYITGEMKSNDRVDFKMLSVEQIKELSHDPLCTLGGHTKSHCRLSLLPQKEQFDEIMSCKQWLEDIIGKPVVHYAFPYGDYDSVSVDVMKGCGIKCSVAAWGGGVRASKNVYEIPRVLVTEDNIK